MAWKKWSNTVKEKISAVVINLSRRPAAHLRGLKAVPGAEIGPAPSWLNAHRRDGPG